MVKDVSAILSVLECPLGKGRDQVGGRECNNICRRQADVTRAKFQRRPCVLGRGNWQWYFLNSLIGNCVPNNLQYWSPQITDSSEKYLTVIWVFSINLKRTLWHTVSKYRPMQSTSMLFARNAFVVMRHKSNQIRWCSVFLVVYCFRIKTNLPLTETQLCGHYLTEYFAVGHTHYSRELSEWIIRTREPLGNE